jgi:predicted 3-demethylubiquinone-9 3-methyltransferase (glyoxalase superfamily)
MAAVQKIAPFLWFNGQLEEAARFYVSVFPNSEIKWMNPMTGVFTLEGVEFMGLNGGPAHKFTPAISLFVKCKDQKEVDLYWNKFLEGGGREDNCGWLQDKWGLSWQIIPDALGRYLSDPDREKANRAMQAMLKMKKIIVADLDKAFNS